MAINRIKEPRRTDDESLAYNHTDIEVIRAPANDSPQVVDILSDVDQSAVRINLTMYSGFYNVFPEEHYDLKLEDAHKLIANYGEPHITDDKDEAPYFACEMKSAPWIGETKKTKDTQREKDPTVPFEGVQRSAVHCVGGQLPKFDLDDATDEEVEAFNTRRKQLGIGGLVFTTHSHKKPGKEDVNRLRFVPCLDRQVGRSEYIAISEYVGLQLFGKSFDDSEHRPEQQAGVWACPADRRNHAQLAGLEGGLISVDKVLALIAAEKPRASNDSALGEMPDHLKGKTDDFTETLAGNKSKDGKPFPIWTDECAELVSKVLSHKRLLDGDKFSLSDKQGAVPVSLSPVADVATKLVLRALLNAVEEAPEEHKEASDANAKRLYTEYAYRAKDLGVWKPEWNPEADFDNEETGGISEIGGWVFVRVAKELEIDVSGFNPGRDKHRQSGDVVLLRGSDIEPEPISWLWKGHLAKGKIHILAGMPGVSKTTLAMSIAATISKGTPLPDGTVCDIGNVLVWSGEDDPKDTLVPRLMANDADLDRIFFVEGTRDESGNHLPFDMSRDVARLASAAGAVGDISLMVVDPIVSAITGDGNSNSDVRKSLQPLVDLASQLDCAVWGISHFTKNSGGQMAVNRVSGSVAFGAVARLVHICSRQKAKEGEPPPNGEYCIMRAKSNISATGGGFSYDILQVLVPSKNHIIEASRIEWRAPLSGTAEEVLASFEAEEKDTGALGEAKNFLESQLSNGPKKYADIRAEAKHESISESTLKRASNALGVDKDLWGRGNGSLSWWNRDKNWPADWEAQKQAWEKAKNA